MSDKTEVNKETELSAREMRAKKFGVPVVLTENEKQAKRLNRFGTDSDSLSYKQTEEQILKRKQKFGEAPTAEELDKIEKRKQKFADSLKNDESTTTPTEEKKVSKKENELENKLDMSLSDIADASKKTRGRGRGRGRGGKGRGGGKKSQGRGRGNKSGGKINPEDLLITKSNGGKRPSTSGEERGKKKTRNE
jgi:hypothetical protein